MSINYILPKGINNFKQMALYRLHIQLSPISALPHFTVKTWYRHLPFQICLLVGLINKRNWYYMQ